MFAKDEPQTGAETVPSSKPTIQAGHTDANKTANQSTPSVAIKSTESDAPVVDKIKFDWYQNSSSVNVSLFIKNAPKDKVNVQFDPRSVSVSFPLPTGSDFIYDFDPLAHTIDVNGSSFKVFGTKIELVLKKVGDIKWQTLLGSDAAHSKDDKTTSTLTTEVAQKGLGIEAPPVYPTSSKSGPKQWDSIIKDEVAEMEKNENENDPNAFFRTIFAQADPDTKRAMMKSYTESNGTALSTNWEETSKKKFDTNPPDGMEAKSWAGR